MKKTNNEYIRTARRKKFIKKIIISFIFMLVCGSIIVTYTDIFKIKKIDFIGENLVTGSFVLEKSESLKGENILFLDEKDFQQILKKNPYIKNIAINKKYPNKLEIDITEKKGLYFVKIGEEYNIISCDMMYVEKAYSIEGRNLIELRGVDLTGKALGDIVEGNKRIEKVLTDIYSVEQEENKIQITALDVSELSKIKAYLGNIEVKIGNDEDIMNKMITAWYIYENNIAKKYIDVSVSIESPDIQ